MHVFIFSLVDKKTTQIDCFKSREREREREKEGGQFCCLSCLLNLHLYISQINQRGKTELGKPIGESTISGSLFNKATAALRLSSSWSQS